MVESKLCRAEFDTDSFNCYHYYATDLVTFLHNDITLHLAHFQRKWNQFSPKQMDVNLATCYDAGCCTFYSSSELKCSVSDTKRSLICVIVRGVMINRFMDQL